MGPGGVGGGAARDLFLHWLCLRGRLVSSGVGDISDLSNFCTVTEWNLLSFPGVHFLLPETLATFVKALHVTFQMKGDDP